MQAGRKSKRVIHRTRERERERERERVRERRKSRWDCNGEGKDKNNRMGIVI